MKKNDVVLGGGILAIALVLFLVMHLTRNEAGNQIQITVDGVVYGTYSLEKNQVIEVKEDDFYNRIRIKMARRIWKRQIVRMDIVKSREKSMVVHRR